MQMLLILAFVALVSGNVAAVLDPVLYRFLTELVINVLRWQWVVIIEERQDAVDPDLAELFFQKNVSVTLLTSRVEPAIRQLLRVYSTVPALLFFSPEVKNRSFLFDTCRIQWVILMPDSSVEYALSDSGNIFKLLQVVFVVRRPEDAFALRVPSNNVSRIAEINAWNPHKGFENSSAFGKCSIKPIKHIKIAMEKHFPFFRPGNSTHPPGGSDINLMNSLAKSLNFTYEIKNPPDGAWGNRNGTEWNGMIGMLIRNEVDAALSGMTITYERHNVVQFTTPYSFDRTVFVTRKPAQRPKTWAIFWPYTYEVWLSLAACIVFIASWLTWLQTRLLTHHQSRLRFQDSLLYVFQSILNQGYYNAQEPRCRVLMSFWWTFCITIIAGYNGSLMSFMAHPGFTPPLDTIMKLLEAVKKGEISVGTIKTSSDYALFKNSEEKDLQLIFQNMKSDPQNFVPHDIDGLREVLRRRYAYIGGWLTVQADVWDPRLFFFSSDSFLQNEYAIAFSPGFDKVDIFNRKILQLLEAGIAEKWIMDMIERNQHRGLYNDKEDEDDGDSDESTLGIDDVQGAFAVLVIGQILAVICCIAENYVAWFSRKKETRFRRWR